MACNSCEINFQSYQSIVVSIQKSGSNALLYVKNQGRNIVLIRRILLCYTMQSGGWGMLYLRPPPDGISWTYPSGFLETGNHRALLLVKCVKRDDRASSGGVRRDRRAKPELRDEFLRRKR